MSRKTKTKKLPQLIAFHVKEINEDKKFWTRIGAAWDHDDGKGFTLELTLIPVGDGRIVLREPEEEKN